jgi:hypothetical protein
MSDAELLERLRDLGIRSANIAAERIEALTAELESTLRDRKLILEERDRTFALMLVRAEAAEADNARLCEKLSEAADALDDACDKLSEFANCLSREPWEALSARHSARDARAAVNPGKEVMPNDAQYNQPTDTGPGDQGAAAGAAEDFETEIIDNWIKRNEPAVPLVSADAILHGLGLMLDGKHIPVREFYAGPEGLFKLKGDTLGLRCATTGCGQHVSVRLERDGVGSDYCEPCGLKAVRA